MQRACAYCKIHGHHIRDCEERKEAEERKRSSASYKQSQTADASQRWQTVRPAATTPKYVPPTLRKVETVKNQFANLYSSSDDEIEEGEIVEEHVRVRPAIISVSDSDNDSIGFTVEGCKSENVFSSSHQQQDLKWNRSGIKGVFVPQCSHTSESSSDDEEEGECDYAALAEGMTFMSEFVAKYKGMSWVDLGSDSD